MPRNRAPREPVAHRYSVRDDTKMHDTPRRWVWAGLASAAFVPGAHAGIEVEIDGLDDDEIRGAVRAALTLTQYKRRDVTLARARYLYGQAEEEIKRALQPFGYYRPGVQSALEALREGILARIAAAAAEIRRPQAG